MAGQLCQMHWNEAALATVGIIITPEFIEEALNDYWEFFGKGLVGHTKVYLPHDQQDPDGPRDGALVGFYDEYSGVKYVHFAPANATIGKPPRHIDILLRKKATGELLMTLEGVAISNGRTGWFAPACANLLLKGRQAIDVFLFGAGKVAEAVILALNHSTGTRIRRIAVLSLRGKSNHDLVNRLQPEVGFQLDAVPDRELLPNAHFVITATNSGKPVFEADEIAADAVTLSLGVDDMPARYIERVLAAPGLIVVDDMIAMESRDVDAVSCFYSRRGLKLTEQGRIDGIRNYVDVLNDSDLMKKLEAGKGPANFSAVGLASLDVAVAARIFKNLIATANEMELKSK